MKQTLIIGLGLSGRAAASVLLKEGRSVIGADRKIGLLQKEIEPLVKQGLKPVFDQEKIEWKPIDQVILSPGVAPSHVLVQEAKKNGIEVIGEIEFAFRRINNRCIGITGTNGKTTTTLLTAHILNEAGIKAIALGNTGESLSNFLLNPDEEAILVVELSSFQLETISTRRLDAAVVLNITPDHLDRYESMEEYGQVKLKIRECLKPGGLCWVSEKVKEEFDRNADLIFDSALAPISQLDYIPMRAGKPEGQNCAAARVLCSLFGVSAETIEEKLQTFQKPPHRIEWVREWNGVSFYNDSKGTNIDAVSHAVGLFEGPLILLVGGVDKGASYRPWIDDFRGKVKMIVAFGQAASKIEEQLGADFPLEQKETLAEAVEFGVKQARPGDTVLLSPGCSSYDQFRDYKDRGDTFKRLIQGLV